MEKWNTIQKITPDFPRNDSGLTQMIMMGKSTRQKWVNKNKKEQKQNFAGGKSIQDHTRTNNQVVGQPVKALDI